MVVVVVSVVLRARLGRARWGAVTGAKGWAASGDDGPLHVTFGLVDEVGRGHESCSDAS